jgi:hypothetical protein
LGFSSVRTTRFATVLGAHLVRLLELSISYMIISYINQTHKKAYKYK